MIPRTIPSRLAFRYALTRILPAQQTKLFRHYTTDHDDKGNIELTKENESNVGAQLIKENENDASAQPEKINEINVAESPQDQAEAKDSKEALVIENTDANENNVSAQPEKTNDSNVTESPQDQIETKAPNEAFWVVGNADANADTDDYDSIPEETQYTNRYRNKYVAKETVDFKQLLGALFQTDEPKPKPVKRRTPNSQAGDLIQKKLWDMIEKRRQPFKEKAPLPRGLVHAVFKSADRRSAIEDRAISSIFDILDSSNSRTQINWSKKNVSEDQRVQLKEHEIKAINDVIDTNTLPDLVHCVQEQINQPNYPNYYNMVLAKAIEHASKKDPYLAQTVFEMAKAKSLESYLWGCDTAVYNAMLWLRWNTWRDVNGMLDLVEEMSLNGIEFDQQSRGILRNVVLDIEGEAEHDEGKELFWNQDEIRACNLMKEMVGKWLI